MWIYRLSRWLTLDWNWLQAENEKNNERNCGQHTTVWNIDSACFHVASTSDQRRTITRGFNIGVEDTATATCKWFHVFNIKKMFSSFFFFFPGRRLIKSAKCSHMKLYATLVELDRAIACYRSCPAGIRLKSGCWIWWLARINSATKKKWIDKKAAIQICENIRESSEYGYIYTKLMRVTDLINFRHWLGDL